MVGNSGLGIIVDRLRRQVDQLEREKAEAWGLKFCCDGHDCWCQGQPVDPPSWWYNAQEMPGWKLRAEAAELSVEAADKLSDVLEDEDEKWPGLPDPVCDAQTVYRETRSTDEYAVLEAKLSHYDSLYHQNKGRGISDSEYDALRRKLEGMV